jgi:hypothetical protein
MDVLCYLSGVLYSINCKLYYREVDAFHLKNYIKNIEWLFILRGYGRRYAVSQLVETLRYKSEVPGFVSRWGYCPWGRLSL